MGGRFKTGVPVFVNESHGKHGKYDRKEVQAVRDCSLFPQRKMLTQQVPSMKWLTIHGKLSMDLKMVI
jgi:hypothetical protein